MRKILLLLLTLSSFAARSQTAAQYTFSAFGGTYTSVATGTSVSILGDDLVAYPIPIGFPFVFCGISYNNGSVCSNGWFSLTNTSTGNNQWTNALSNVTPYVPGMLMPLWDDLGGATGSASYKTTGTAPNRVFTMEWQHWEWNVSNADVISFEMKLYETTNVIQYIYKQESGSPSGVSATIGIANSTTDYQTLNNTSTAPVSSSTTFNTSISASPATGQVYQYTPPPVCSGTPTASITGPSVVCPSTAFTLNGTVPAVTGLTYVWQSSPAGANTFAAVGPTTVNYNVPGITAATDYRLIVTCSASGQSFTSNLVSVGINPPYICTLCVPTYSNGGGGDNIVNVVLGPLSNNTSAAGNVSPYYHSYISQQPSPLAIPNLVQGSTSNVAVTFGTDGSQYSMVWIDLNHDGVLSTTESFTTNTSPGGSGTVNIPLAIPLTALTGITTMRIRGGDDTQPTNTQACGASNSTFGEAEDYLVNILPSTPAAPVLTSTSPVCQGSVLTITATIPTGYTTPSYTISGPGIATPITNSTGIFTFPGATPAYTGTYSVTVTAGGNTSPASTIAVTVYPDPTITLGTVTGPTACATATGTIIINGLGASTAYTVRYRKGGVQQTPISATSTAGGSYTITGLGFGTYDSIRAQTTNGCFTNILGPITLSDPNPPAAPTLTANFPLCSGSTLTLTAASSGTAYPTTGTTYTFTGPATPLTVSGNTATHANFIASNNGNYTVTVVVNGCTSATTTAAVAVTPASAAPAVTNVSYCQNSTAGPLYNSVTGVNPRVYDSATAGGHLLATGFIPSTAVAGTTTYYATQSNPCESPRIAFVVTIKPTPLPPTVVNPISFCQYEVVSPLTAQGTNLLWYTTATGGTGTTVAPTPVTTIPGTYNFYVSQTATGCEGPRAIISVTIKQKPAPPVVQPITYLCQNDPPAPLTAIGQSLLWYTTATGGVGVTTAPVPNVGFEDSFLYYVSQRVNGCESDRAQMKVIVNYRPNGIIIASRPWVCNEDTLKVTYYGNAHPDAVYSWHTPNPATTILSGNNTQGPLVVRFNQPGDQILSLQINNKGCLSQLITTEVNVRELPTVSFATSKSDICTDQVVNVAINHISGNISDYNWTGFDGATVSYGTYNGGPFGLSWSQPGNHIVTLVVTSRECNSHAAMDTIDVHAYPDATIHYNGGESALSICASDSLNLSVTPGFDPATYVWTPTAYFYNRSDSTPSVWVTPKFSGTVKVKVTSIYGCSAQDSVSIEAHPCCGVTFPTAFAPGGNVIINRIFHPITIGNHEVKSFRVINRWGQVIFETTDERRGWDGTFNGAPQDMGMYYWYFHYKCADGQDLEEKGEVLLMR